MAKIYLLDPYLNASKNDLETSGSIILPYLVLYYQINITIRLKVNSGTHYLT